MRKIKKEVLPQEEWIDCTGDVVCGDIIKFEEAIFSEDYMSFQRRQRRSRRRRSYGGRYYYSPSIVGKREIVAEVLKESYGEEKQQHTFTLKVIRCRGTDPVRKNTKIFRKGRNIYRNGTERLRWENEEKRELVQDEKHERGDCAREDREIRKLNQNKENLYFS